MTSSADDPPTVTPPQVCLRPVQDADLPHFFAHEQDEVARQMAAFVSGDLHDRVAFEWRWAWMRRLGDVTMRTIELEGAVAGHIGTYVMDGETQVTYWLDRAVWGRGVASQALHLLLHEVPTRPLFGRAAADNLASVRVLQRAGFVIIDRQRAFADARGAEIDEVILRLDT